MALHNMSILKLQLRENRIYNLYKSPYPKSAFGRKPFEGIRMTPWQRIPESNVISTGPRTSKLKNTGNIYMFVTVTLLKDAKHPRCNRYRGTILKLCKPDASRLVGIPPRFWFIFISAWRDWHNATLSKHYVPIESKHNVPCKWCEEWTPIPWVFPCFQVERELDNWLAGQTDQAITFTIKSRNCASTFTQKVQTVRFVRLL